MSEDAAVVASNAYKVVLENDQIRVLELRMDPGERTAPHAHPDMVAIMINGGTFRFGGPHSSTTPSDLEIEGGSVSYQPADRHTTENIGEKPVFGFLIELKNGSTP